MTVLFSGLFFSVLAIEPAAPLEGEIRPCLGRPTMHINGEPCAPVIYVQSRLIWAMPLVLDGEYPVIDAFSVSWWLTGRLLRGFGMFIMLSLLAALATAAAIVVSSLSAAVLAGL